MEFLVHVCDPSFSVYVTPWIIRVTWIFALIIGALNLVGMLLAIIAPGITERQNRPQRNPMGPVLPDFGFIPDFVGEYIGRFLVAGIYIVFLVLSLLWLRVILEVCIVLFDISSTLKKIDGKKD